MTTTAVLSWTPPTLKADGSPLNNLAGFEIHYYIDEIANIQTPIIINDPVQSVQSIPDIPNGTMGFRMRAFDDNGNQSGWTQWNNQDTSGVPPMAPGDFVVNVTIN